MSIERTWMNVRIAKRTFEAEDIVSLELVSDGGHELPVFGAGSHIDVEVGPDLVRQYSLCNNSQDRLRYVIAVLRDPASRGGSIAIHERFSEGDLIRISEPRNHFPLQATTGTALLMGGGIGVTPLLCMAERLHSTGGAFKLHYCTRSRERTAFHDQIKTSPLSPNVSFHFDCDGDAGRFDPAAALRALGPQDHAYVCGPAGFIDWVDAAANSVGWPKERLHREYFSAGDHDERDASNAGFAVKIASTGQTIDVGADETIAAALEKKGIEVLTSCDQGVCGTCIVRVLEGDPDHRDLLGLEGNSEFTPCCSRSFSPLLVLDL